VKEKRTKKHVAMSMMGRTAAGYHCYFIAILIYIKFNPNYAQKLVSYYRPNRYIHPSLDSFFWIIVPHNPTYGRKI